MVASSGDRLEVLRKWQQEAFTQWKVDRRGIVEAVTGSGKTTLALRCIADFTERRSDGLVLVVVPTRALLDQWYAELLDDLGYSEKEIGILGKGLLDGKRLVIGVINTARTRVNLLPSERSTLLVVDECHRAGSERNAAIFSRSYAETLGLSATPERQYDDGFERFVRPALGDIIYRYGYERAHEDGVIVPFDLVNIEFDLTPEEQGEFDKLTKRIAVAMSRNDGQVNDQVKALLLKRATVSWNSVIRIPLAIRLALDRRKDRQIIFHESIPHATAIWQGLRERGIRCGLYHTGVSEVARRENLRLYRSGQFTCIVCCRALDEGLDVPKTSVGIIACSTASTRQRIQRLGRVLRRAEGKQSAVVSTLYATKPERERLVAEASQLADLASVRWMRSKVSGDV